MEKRENPVPLNAWMTAAILAPLAIAAPESGWVTNLLVGILAAVVLPWVKRSKRQISRWIWIVQIVWCIVLLIYYLGFLSLIWKGSGDLFMPACMLLLGLWGARKGKFACASVGAVLLWLVFPFFGGICLAAAEDIVWKWAVRNGMEYSPSVITAYLIPGMMWHLSGERKEREGKWYILLPVIGSVLCLVVRGTVPKLEPGTIGLSELSRGVEVFGRVMRLEAIAAMAMTVSLFCLLSMLLTSVKYCAESISKNRKEWILDIAAIVVHAGMLFKMTISDEIAAIGSVICWVILPLATQFVGPGKK